MKIYSRTSLQLDEEDIKKKEKLEKMNIGPKATWRTGAKVILDGDKKTVNKYLDI